MGLRAVSLELLPLALVLGHAVRAPVLELDLAGKNGLQNIKPFIKNSLTLCFVPTSQSASPYLLVKQSYIIPALAAVSDPKL